MAAFIAGQKTGHDVPHAITCQALGVSQPWFSPSAVQQRPYAAAQAA
ncbi:hypothetical protein [Actinoallomurus sp. NPDC050550]